ncbi:MAG: GIY-YIG nuclease family protein [Nanobdellota archaeon]
MPWHVYLLECRNGSVYTGATNDVPKRMKMHKEGRGSRYVARKGFSRLLHTIRAVDKIDAMKIEYRVKQLSRNDKITFFVNHPDRDYSVLDS